MKQSRASTRPSISADAGSARRENVHNAQEQNVSPPRSEDDESGQEGAVDHEELLYNFRAAKEQFEDAEFLAETRHSRFAEERFDNERSEHAERFPVVDARQYRRRQVLTRVVIEAEKKFPDAEDALLEAGCQPGSDLTSGLIDDVNDTYHLSLEEDMIDHVDKSRMHGWLSNLPEPGANISQVDFASRTPEVDPWEGDDVNVYDSWSLVADGADRRRIDRWRVLATS